MRRFVSISALLGASLLHVTASALVTPPRTGASTSGPLEASGALVAPAGLPPLRHEVSTHHGAPPRALAGAWATFVADTTSPRWRAIWDSDTLRPLRVYGGFVEAPGTSQSAAAAEGHARAFLARHAALLLAGRSIDDFELTVSRTSGGLRTVGFRQVTTAGGVKVPVLGAGVSVRYRADRLFLLGAEALPVSPFEAPQITAAAARAAALAHIQHSQPAAVEKGAELVALPLVRKGSLRVVLAFRVATESASPASLTDVFVDARDGSVLATRENIHFLTGSLKIDAPVRGPSEHNLYSAPSANLSIGGVKAQTDADGVFSVDPAPASMSCFASSHLVQVVNLGGPDEVSLAFTPEDGGQVVWSLKDDELGDAQISAFVHTSIAKDTARTIDPELTFLDKTLSVRVNQDDPSYACNAYWNGVTMNFFQEHLSCNNTARVADVVYHEFGHAFHTNSIVPGTAYDPSLAEGGADYFASIVTNDPYLAPGFFKNGGYLREMDTDRRWPEDISWDPHETGLIFAGAMWDLRTLLEEDLGLTDGPPLAHKLYQGILRGASNLPTTYPEILAADDDDGDLGNGTPHVCQIVKAFAPHGLTPYISGNGLVMTHVPPRVIPGQSEPYELKVALSHAFPQCAVDEDPDGIDVKWRTPVSGGTVPMSKEGDEWVAKLPGQITGTQIRYSVIGHTGGLTSPLPANLADPEYKVFAGDVIPLYCTDFEQGADGWTFGEVDGKATDFTWGPADVAGGDPASAASGTSVIGTTLGGLGIYRRNRTSFADSPPVDTGSHTRVRLQYMRWLTVEDAAYDQARILINGYPIWANAVSDSPEYSLDHRDGEWRFDDFDVSNSLAGGGHTIQVRFDLSSDNDLEYGGWNIDDFCIVAWEPPSADGGAGGAGGGGAGGDGGDNPADPGCSCSTTGGSGAAPWGALGLAALASALGRRRARRPAISPGRERRP